MGQNKKKLIVSILGVFVLLLLVGGVTYAFFNYTREGPANTVSVGRIYFNSTQDTITIANVFPIRSIDLETDINNHGELTIEIIGDTTYSEGIEYLVTSGDTSVVLNGKVIPIKYSVSSTNLGSESSNYWIERGGNTSVYETFADGGIVDGKYLAVGYIASGNEGVNGSITISAYVDANEIAITDTSDKNTEWQQGRTIISTSEWNSLANSPLSFKIKVEAREGIWVNNFSTNTNIYQNIVSQKRGIAENVSGNTFFTTPVDDQDTSTFGVYELERTNNNETPIYFFHGDNSLKNNVLFDGYCWKIVRTTDTGGVRMIYNGLPNSDGQCTLTSLNDGEGTYISMYEKTNSGANSDYIYPGSDEDKTGYTLKSIFPYNVNYNQAKYVGFTYDNNVDSNFKKILDAWYDGAISDEGDSLVESSMYCNDRRIRSNNNQLTIYNGPFHNEIDLSCDVNDQYNTKVGFIIADDLKMAAGKYDKASIDYLYNTTFYWTGTPNVFNKMANPNQALVLNHKGNFNTVLAANPVRPVITLKNNVNIINGDGSQLHPYKVNNVVAYEGFYDDNSGDYLKSFATNFNDTCALGNNAILKDNIKRVYTVTSNTVPNDAISSWDVSGKQNGSVMAYVKNSDTEGMYDLYIGQDGGVIANRDSSALLEYYHNMVEADLSNLIIDNTEIIDFIFHGCTSLTALDLSGWNTSNITSMNALFRDLSNLTTLNLTGWNTSNVINMGFMFNGCSKLATLDLSSFDMSKVTNTYAMFQYAGIKTLIMPNNYTRIDNFMFNHNTSYNSDSFTIPKTVTSVGFSHIFYDFGKDSTFNKFIVESGSTTLKTIDDILYSYDGTTLISIPRGKTFTNNTYEMPEGVTSLNIMSFSRSKKIDKVILPNSYVIERWHVDTAGDVDPVKGNSLATAIYIFTSVKEYEVKNDNPRYSSDSGCIYSKDGTELIAVPVHYNGVLNIKSGTITIGQEAFWKQRVSQIDNLTQINIPASVTTIEANQLTTLNTLMSRSTNPVTITIDSGNTAYQVVNNQIVAI